METASETWRPIPEYEGHYDVSDLGRVRSWKKWRSSVPLPRLMTLSPESEGYLICSLSMPGRRIAYKVHTLVMLAFCGERPADLPLIRHLNDDKADNRLANLVYGTLLENAWDREDIKPSRAPTSLPDHCYAGHPRFGDNLYVAPDGTQYCRECRRQARYRRREKRLQSGV